MTWTRFYLNIGFKEEELKVQLDSTGNLRIRGERPLEGQGQYWSRFRKDFRIPENTVTGNIRAKLENEHLSIILPKLVRSQTMDQPAKVSEPDPGKKNTPPETRPREDRDRTSQKDDAATEQSNENIRRRRTGEPTNAVKKEQNLKEEAKKAASQIVDRDAELADSRKRKAEDEKTADGRDGLVVPKPTEGGLGGSFKRPRQLMVNVGVAAIILVGLAFYVSYKLTNSG